MQNFRNYFTRSCSGTNFINSSQSNHNLQEGLFQIATHTCSLLVQVNNTNNISFSRIDETNPNIEGNVQCTNFTTTTSTSTSATARRGNIITTRTPVTTTTASASTSAATNSRSARDQDQLVVLLPQQAKNGGKTSSGFGKYRHRLSVSILESV